MPMVECEREAGEDDSTRQVCVRIDRLVMHSSHAHNGPFQRRG